MEKLEAGLSYLIRGREIFEAHKQSLQSILDYLLIEAKFVERRAILGDLIVIPGSRKTLNLAF